MSASANSLDDTASLPSPSVGKDFNGRTPILSDHYQLESSGTANIIEFGSDGGNSDPTSGDLDYILHHQFSHFNPDDGDWK